MSDLSSSQPGQEARPGKRTLVEAMPGPDPLAPEGEARLRIARGSQAQIPATAYLDADRPAVPLGLGALLAQPTAELTTLESSATLYQRLFPGGALERHGSLDEAITAHAADLAALRALAADVDLLQCRARAGDDEARAELRAKGPRLMQDGERLSKILYSHAASYADVLRLHGEFLTGAVPATPVFTGLPPAAMAPALAALRALADRGVVVWEARAGGSAEVVDPDLGVSVRSFATLEMSGPPRVMAHLLDGLDAVPGIHVVRDGESQSVAQKRYTAPTLEGLAAWVGRQRAGHQFSEPERAGGAWVADWYDLVQNRSKYLGRARQRVPSLGPLIGDHVYLHLIAADLDLGAALCDAVVALLDEVPRAEDWIEGDTVREHEAYGGRGGLDPDTTLLF